MVRKTIWRSIAQSLTADIAGGRYGPGDKLPTEAELAARFGVNRHTVRRALQDLSAQGLIHTRRGSGAFVASKPTDYPIGRRVRFHQNLQAAGRMPAKDVLAIETRNADAREAEALRLAQGAQVHVYEGLSLADGHPIALFRCVFPAERLPGLPDALRAQASVTRALEMCGVPDYMRESTRLTSKLANPTQALLLKIPEGAPILRAVSVSLDPAGQPVEYGHTWFAGDRVTLTVAP